MVPKNRDLDPYFFKKKTKNKKLNLKFENPSALK
jgi:hypothetical protein